LEKSAIKTDASITTSKIPAGVFISKIAAETRSNRFETSLAK